jgi:probable F420-dependent oxidoreductase
MRLGWFGLGSGRLADAAGVAELAVAAEDAGYESVWVGEHPVLIDPHEPPSPLPSTTPLLDPVPVLTYAAAVTTRVRLGTGILILPLRNPVILAKQLASLDVLSGGRVLCGIGVGYVPGEYAAVGVPWDDRGQRTDDHVDALRALWRDDPPRLDAATVAFDGIQCRPRPLQPGGVPILMSGMSRPARRRAVLRGDGWYGFFLDLERTAAAVAELAELEAHHGRPAGLGPLEITITPPPGPLTRDDVARYADLGVTRLVLMREFADMGGEPDAASRQQIVDDLRRQADVLGPG